MQTEEIKELTAKLDAALSYVYDVQMKATNLANVLEAEQSAIQKRWEAITKLAAEVSTMHSELKAALSTTTYQNTHAAEADIEHLRHRVTRLHGKIGEVKRQKNAPSERLMESYEKLIIEKISAFESRSLARHWKLEKQLERGLESWLKGVFKPVSDEISDLP